jgi:uncharacterized membrane protein YcaP (DUF421 family)
VTAVALPLRALLMYLYLLLLTRLAGKRALKQTTALDLVVALILSSLAASFAFGDLSAATAIAGTGTILLLHLGVHYVSFRSAGLARLLGLRPSDDMLETGAPPAAEEDLRAAQ